MGAHAARVRAGRAKKSSSSAAAPRISAWTGVDRAEEQQRLVDQVAAEVAQDAAARRPAARVGGEPLERRLEPGAPRRARRRRSAAHGEQVGVPAAVLVDAERDPGRGAASTAITSRASAASSANGLSHTTARPSPIACRARAVWVCAGVEMATADGPGRREVGRGCRRRGRPGWSRCQLGSPLGRAGHHPGQLAPRSAQAISGAWKLRPPKPYPTRPIRTGSSAMGRS